MRRIKVIICLMVLSFISSFLFNIENANAGIESSTAGVENATAFSCYVGGNCYSVGTGGMRVAIIDKNGNIKGNIVDYWFVDSQTEFYSARASKEPLFVTLDKKYMKQDLENSEPSIKFTEYTTSFYTDESQRRYTIDRLDSKSLSTIHPSTPEPQDQPYESKQGIIAFMTQKYCKGHDGLDPYEIHAKNNINNQPCVLWTKNNKEVGGETGYYIKSSVKLNVRNANAVETVINRIVANGKGVNEYKGQGNFNKKTRLYLDQIQEDVGKPIDYTSDYLQIEPLTQWGNHGIKCKTGPVIFVGTPSEFSYIVNDLMNGQSSKLMSNFSTDEFAYGLGNYGCAFNHYNASMYFNLVTYGVTTPDTDIIPTDSNGEKIFEATTDKELKNLVNKPDKESQYFQARTIAQNPRKAFGVSFIKLSDVGSDCTSIASKYLQENGATLNGLKKKMDTSNINENLYSWINGYKTYGFKDLKDVGKYLSSKSDSNCPEPTCDDTAERLLSPSLGLNQAKIKENLIYLYGGIKDGETGVANLDAYFTSPKLYTNTKNLCGAQSCNDLLTSKVLKGSSYDESSLKALSNLFPNYALLDAELIKELEVNPRCESVNPCLATPAIPACDSHHSFSFEDAKPGGKNSTCELGKYAYNYAETNNKGEIVGEVHRASVQTSIDKDYGKEGYCREEVVFDFPREVENVTGGSIMKWGTDKSKNSTVFGTMQVRRTCYIDSPNVSNPFTIRSDWANIIDSKLDINHKGRINPSIKMYYKEAVEDPSKALTLSGINMETYLSKFTMKVVGGKGTGKESSVTSTVEYDRNYNVIKGEKEDTSFTNTYREFRCEGDCGTIYRVEMEASYEIDYPQRLKWYSDSSDKFKKKNAKDVEKSGVADAKYVALGYGLPTSFLTPSSYDTWYGKSSKDSSGYMYVTLANVGTKNTGSGYHFDKYMKYYVGNEYKIDDTTVKYSCGFSIENILYDYEHPTPKKSEEPPCEVVLGRKICPASRVPKGIDVVFRTVELVSSSKELEKAFPGRSGSGREVGYNWNIYQDKNILDDADTILKNVVAKILSDDIYENEPKYVIDLNSVNIQNIRKENDKDSYTSMKNYEFVKRSVEPFNNQDSEAANECTVQNKRESCRKFAYMFRNKAEANGSLNGFQSDYAYIYGASPFISDLIKKGDLKGTCATNSDTKKRAQEYAESYGC